jgi:hypothetical protein
MIATKCFQKIVRKVTALRKYETKNEILMEIFAFEWRIPLRKFESDGRTRFTKSGKSLGLPLKKLMMKLMMSKESDSLKLS